MRSFARALRMTERASLDRSPQICEYPAADGVDATADALLDPAELLEDPWLEVTRPFTFSAGSLASSSAARAIIERRLAARIVEAVDQLVIDGAGRRHDAPGRHATDGDARRCRR